jgi:hypothetical protein
MKIGDAERRNGARDLKSGQSILLHSETDITAPSVRSSHLQSCDVSVGPFAANAILLLYITLVLPEGDDFLRLSWR